MSRWGTIFLLLLACGVAAFLFIFEPNLRSLRSSESSRTKLLAMDPLQVQGLRITSGSNCVEITKQPDGWFLGPEHLDRADPQRVADILTAASEMTIHDIVPAAEVQSEKDLKPFGLADPRNKLEILGPTPTVIHFGREAIGENRVYVRLDSDQTVYVVTNPLEDTPFLNWESFRDRRLTHYDASAIDRLIIRRPNGELEIERTPKGWELKRPLRAPADTEKVTSLLNALLGASIQRFSQDSSGTTPGLNHTAATEILFFPDTRDTPESLFLTEETDADGQPETQLAYPTRKSSFVMDRSYAQLVAIHPEQLRDRRLLPLNLDTVDVIRIERAGDALATWKRNGDGWSRDDGQTVVSAAMVGKQVNGITTSMVSTYTAATPNALDEANLGADAIVVHFDATISENTPEAAAGQEPVSRLKIGTIDSASAQIQVNETPEVCSVPAAAIREFLDFALEPAPETLPPESTPESP